MPSQGPISGRNGYVTPASSGFPRRGDKIKPGQKKYTHLPQKKITRQDVFLYTTYIFPGKDDLPTFDFVPSFVDPRMQGMRSISAPFGAPGKAGVM